LNRIMNNELTFRASNLRRSTLQRTDSREFNTNIRVGA
jgi:hypothetical protein